MVGYTCPIRSSQFSQTNDRSWNLAKYTKLRDGKEDALTAESRLCVVINMSRRCLSVLSGKTTLEEMSLIGLPTPIVKTRDHDVFFRLSSHEGNVLAKFRIKFLTTLDRCAFTALLSNYVEVISADGNRTSRTISQPTSRNDSSFLFHSQTQSQRENLPLGSCSQSSTSSYASMQSLLQSQSTQNTCSQNTTQRSLVCSTFSSQSSQMVSQSTNAFSQNTSAFSQPLSIFSQSTTGLSSSLSSNRSHFSMASDLLSGSRKQNADDVFCSSRSNMFISKNAKEANLSYEHDDRLSQKVQNTSSGASCQNSLLSFTSFSQGFSKSGSLDGENERASSQPNSTLFNTTKSSTAGTLAAHVDSVIRSVTTKLPTSDDQVVPSIDAEDVLPSTNQPCHQTPGISSSGDTSRSSIHNTEFNNASFVADCAKRQHCDDDVGSLQIVPESIVDTMKNIGDDSAAVEGIPLRDAVGNEPPDGDGDVAQSIIPSRVDAATQTNRQLTIDDLLKDDELLRKFVVKRLNDPTFIAFQRRFSTAQLRHPAKKQKATRTRKNGDRKESGRNWMEDNHI